MGWARSSKQLSDILRDGPVAGDEFTGRLFVCTKFFRSVGANRRFPKGGWEEEDGIWLGLLVSLVLGCPGQEVRING